MDLEFLQDLERVQEDFMVANIAKEAQVAMK